MLRTLLARVVELLGFAPLLAFDGVEAIEQAHQAGDQLAAAVLDVTMPQLSGIEAATVLRATRPELPIILMSARPLVVMGTELDLPRNTLFFAKPFALSELEDVLEGVREATKERSLGASGALA
jgi:DNA-binding response OmpR family regulator